MPRNNKSSNLILLDTHVWVWFANGDQILANSPCLSKLKKGFKEKTLRVCLISAWELAMLESKGRLSFRKGVLNWIEKSLQVPGLEMLPLTPETAVKSCQLPKDFHGDPADRMITATAIEHDALLITKDRKILDYSRRSSLKTLTV